MLCHTKFDFDYELFLKEYWNLKEYEKDYARGGKSISNLRMIRDKDNKSEHANAFADMIKHMFSLPGKVSSRFIFLKANTSLPEHTDSDTECAINFLLTGDGYKQAPVIFNGIEYHYKQALLNTQIPHMVHNGPMDRIIFKVSIFDMPYSEVKNLFDLTGYVQSKPPIGSVHQQRDNDS